MSYHKYAERTKQAMFPEIFAPQSPSRKAAAKELKIIAAEQLEIDKSYQQNLYFLCSENSVEQAHAEYWSAGHYYASLIQLKEKVKRLEKRKKQK